MSGQKRSRRKPQPQSKAVSWPVWLRSVGVALLMVSAVTLLSLLSFTHSTLTGSWLQGLRLAFGWGAFLAPLGLGAFGLWLFLRGFGRAPDVPTRIVGGILLAFTAGLSLLHYFALEPDVVAASGKGGGYLGWYISRALIDGLGDLGAFLVLLTLMGMSIITLIDIPLADIWVRLRGGWNRVAEWYRVRSLSRRVTDPPRDDSLAATLMSKIGEQERRRQDPVAPPASVPQAGALALPGGSESARQQWKLPSVEGILERGIEQELSEAEIRAKVRIIEETLSSFGVPAKVVEVNQGPTVTQFGLEPGFMERKDAAGKSQRVKVKVNRISGLADDLSLALAANPIRIEAPVPGRSLVGIEVPNTSIAMVSLESVIESDAFRRLGAPLGIALGQDVAGQPIVADLAQMPHLLIAGATGSGKSVCINVITACLLLNNTPDDLRLVMIDPKMVELISYNGIPHLLVPVVIEVERVVTTLKWVTGEMDRRYRIFSKMGARNLESYNGMVMARGEKKLPYIVVLIDELADLMMVSPDEVERSICRIAQLARATGIHLVIATQRPSVNVVTGLIKANFPARISFAVTSQVDSRVVLDTGGAEKLLGRGDMLYMASDSSKLVRLQGCYITDKELERLVSYWHSFEGAGPLPAGAPLIQQPLWKDMLVREQEAGTRDDLLDQAIALVREQQRASISLLQRRLRIGYSRAARLIDVMEEMKIIGPEEGAARARQVLPDPQPPSEARPQ